MKRRTAWLRPSRSPPRPRGCEAQPVLGPDRIEIAGQSRAMDLGYHMPLRFYGPEGSFKRISAVQVLRGGLDPEALRGKVVIVGVTATGASDAFATPFDRVAPGAEVFATAIGNLMAGDGLARTPSTRRLDAAAAIALPVLMIALMAMRRAATGLTLASLVFVLWLGGVFLAFVNGYWLSVAAPLASVVPLTVGFAAARSIVERRAGTKIAAENSTLARFQSPLLLDQLLREPDFLEKPVRQDVAVMFVDLSGSTGVAEALGPEWTRDLFGAMQTLVEGEVTAHGGVVINYMGDGVLAVFGLPKPRSDDAARALGHRRGASRVDDRLAGQSAARGAGTSGFPDRPAFRPGHPVPARFADPTADHRHGRHRQRCEPASGSGQAAALPCRRHGGSFSSRERDGADRRISILGSTRRSPFRFAVERAICRFAFEPDDLRGQFESRRHREQRSDAAIRSPGALYVPLDHFVSLVMTTASPSVVGQLAASA